MKIGHVIRFISLCAVYSLVMSISNVSAETSEKFVKPIRGIGDVKYVMYYTQAGKNQPIQVNTHRLLLVRENEEDEIIWEGRRTVTDSTISKSVDIYRNSQIVDVTYIGNTCSFLLSTLFGIKYIQVRKIDNSWNAVYEGVIFDETYSYRAKLRSIKLISTDAVLTKTLNGDESVFQIIQNGKIRPPLEPGRVGSAHRNK